MARRQRKIIREEIICVWRFCNNPEPCFTIITLSDILHLIKQSNRDMEMNGFQLCKLIKKGTHMFDKRLTCWTPQGKWITTHLENKSFAFQHSGVSLGEILGDIYRCKKPLFMQNLSLLSQRKIEVVSAKVLCIPKKGMVLHQKHLANMKRISVFPG